jgi:hypothetical protein
VLLIEDFSCSSVVPSQANPVDIDHEISSSDDEHEDEEEPEHSGGGSDQDDNEMADLVMASTSQTLHGRPIESNVETDISPVLSGPSAREQDEPNIATTMLGMGNPPPVLATTTPTVSASIRPVCTVSRRRRSVVDNDDCICADCELAISEADLLHCDGPLCTEKVHITVNTDM